MKPQMLLAVSVVLYFASLTLPAISFSHHEPLSGLYVLSWGWWGFLSGDFAWFANPAYVVGAVCLCTSRYRASFIACSCAVVLGLLSFFTKQWWFNEGFATAIAGLGVGFYVWLLSLFCFVARHRMRVAYHQR